MWGATLLTSGAAAFGRLLVVNLMPSSVLVLAAWISVRTRLLNHGHASVLEITGLSGRIDTMPILLALFTAALLAALTQSFQIGFVRLLEGYWTRWPLGRSLAGWGAGRQETQMRRLRSTAFRESELASQARQALEDPAGLSCQDQRRYRRLRRRAAIAGPLAEERAATLYPPEGIPLLPTRLGNAMRSFEHRAGERYGYSTIAAWPRLYPYLSDRLATSLHSAIDALHATVNFTVAFLASALVLAAGTWNHPVLRWAPLACLVFALFAYRSAIAAASVVGLMEFVSFDLHRMDMLDGLRQALPSTGREEIRRARELSLMLRETEPDQAQDIVSRMTYSGAASDKAAEGKNN